MAYSPGFLLFNGQVFAVFAAYAGSRPSALDGSDAGRIFFHQLRFKVSPLVRYYPLNTVSRGPAPNRRYIVVGVLFPADARRMPVSLCKFTARADFVDCGAGVGQKGAILKKQIAMGGVVHSLSL